MSVFKKTLGILVYCHLSYAQATTFYAISSFVIDSFDLEEVVELSEYRLTGLVNVRSVGGIPFTATVNWNTEKEQFEGEGKIQVNLRHRRNGPIIHRCRYPILISFAVIERGELYVGVWLPQQVPIRADYCPKDSIFTEATKKHGPIMFYLR